MGINVAIDGPGGAGKSTIARGAAARLGYVYVDTGAMYRCIGLHVRRKGCEPTDGAAVEGMLGEIEIGIRYEREGEQRTILNGEDVTEEIRSREASEYAYKVSAHAGVRRYLLGVQREIAKADNVVMDGRDIGTEVLPGAEVKIYMTADIGVRAERRQKEMGGKESIEEVRAAIEERDRGDMERKESPLRRAEGAVEIDTTGLTIEESIERVCELVRIAGG